MVELGRLLAVNKIDVQNLHVVLVALVGVIVLGFAFVHEVDFGLRQDFAGGG